MMMPPPKQYTLADIRSHALSKFPNEFANIKIPIPPTQRHLDPKDIKIGHVLQNSKVINVYFHDNSLGPSQIYCTTDAPQQKLIVEQYEDIALDEPFCWVTKQADQDDMNELEVFLQYCSLVNGGRSHIDDETGHALKDLETAMKKISRTVVERQLSVGSISKVAGRPKPLPAARNYTVGWSKLHGRRATFEAVDKAYKLQASPRKFDPELRIMELEQALKDFKARMEQGGEQSGTSEGKQVTTKMVSAKELKVAEDETRYWKKKYEDLRASIQDVLDKTT